MNAQAALRSCREGAVLGEELCSSLLEPGAEVSVAD